VPVLLIDVPIHKEQRTRLCAAHELLTSRLRHGVHHTISHSEEYLVSITLNYVVPPLAALALVAGAQAAPIALMRSASGADAASVQPAVTQFLSDLGGVNNGTTPGSQASGHRIITWDGGGAAADAATFTSPMTTFSNRGNVYTTAGTGFEISGQPSPEFGDINVTYPDVFVTFSSPRLFAVLGSNVMDVHFTVPGTTDAPALSSGFGAIFTDVDIASATILEFFDANGNLIGGGPFAAPVQNNGLSFIGVSFGESAVSRVRITAGNAALGPDDAPGTDVVAMDDFIFGEPQAIPEPAGVLTLASGLALLAVYRRRRRVHARNNFIFRP
jgi:hypothetical protein